MADPVRDFALDANGDLGAFNGDYAPVAGQAACQQGAQIRIKTYLTEVYLDESLGVDHINRVLIKNADPLVIRALISAAILDTPDVTAVVGANLIGPDASRSASITYKMRTVYTQSPVSDTVEVI